MPVTTSDNQIDVLASNELQQTLGCGCAPHGLQSLAVNIDPMPPKITRYVLYLGSKLISTYLNNCNALCHSQERQGVGNRSAGLASIFPGNADSCREMTSRPWEQARLVVRLSRQGHRDPESEI